MIGVWYDKTLRRITVVLKAFKCSWNKCIFCCFSDEAAKTYEELMKVNVELLRKAQKMITDEKVDDIVFFNGGSFFELPYQLILKISELTKNLSVEIETRPEFLSENSLLKTYELLSPKRLVVRMGFESVFQEVRNKLNKGITDLQIKEVYRLRESVRKKLKDKILERLSPKAVLRA